MGLIPLALGGCYVYSVAIPVVGTLLFTLLPWVMVLAWAWLGMDCGRQRRPFWLSLLAGHWGVLLSVLCGAWQFWLVDDAARSIPIALFGQFISGVVPGAMMLVTPLCIVDGTYMGSLLVVWGGIASAVLLICSILEERQLAGYLRICDELGMSALTDAHDEVEVKMALNAGARIIGVNNRNLRDFSVDSENSRRLRKMIPEDVLFVSESGVSSPEDVSELRKNGADAVLIGETLMRASDKKAKLNQLRGDAL